MKFLLLSCFVAGVVLASCTSQRYSYNPPAFINPTLTEKGQTDIGILYSTGPADGASSRPGRNNGLDAHTAYAVSDRFAVIGSYSLRAEKDNYYEEWNINGTLFISDATVRYKRNIFQAGGLYSHLFPGKKNGISLSLLFGYTTSQLSERGRKDNTAYDNFFKSRGGLIAIQPTFNFGQQKSLKWSLITRVNILKISWVQTDYTSDQMFDSGLLNLDKETLLYGALGVAAQYQLKKLPWLKFNAQFMFSSSGETDKYMRYARGSLYSGGVSIDLSRLGDHPE